MDDTKQPFIKPNRWPPARSFLDRADHAAHVTRGLLFSAAIASVRFIVHRKEGAVLRAPTDLGRRIVMRIPSSGVANWITMVSGAFLISIGFLVAFIAADAWMSRQPVSIQNICSNMLELYKSRDDITANEKWWEAFSRLRDDCTVALHKYELTSTRD
jgi:hypothetical protein